ncbi:MAG: cysteine hydrolase [Myxococcota bacterium]|nr:cysteine hydrolase [Myxococcota bacterium]
MSARRASEPPQPPREGPVALLLIDVINDLEFVGGDKLLRHALPTAKKLAALTARARAASVPVIYANDNFGHWRSDFRAQVRHCLRDGVRGGAIAQLLRPGPTDYFVLKPKHSAFFLTALEALLHALGTRTLVMAGLAGDNCVLFTAHDAYMREYRLFVPEDGIASESLAANRWALRHMQRFLKVDTRKGARIDFGRLKASSSRAKPARRGVTTRRDEV